MQNKHADTSAYRYSTMPDIRADYDRELDWRGFLDLWTQTQNSTKTDKLAKALLFVGTEIPILATDNPPPKDYENTRIGLTEERIDFYLCAAGHLKSKTIAETAQQLLVKHWLRTILPSAGLPRTVIYKVHKKALIFLQADKSALQKPPYPRFIQQFLIELQNQHGKEKKEKKYQLPSSYDDAFTDLLISAMLTWGLADHLNAWTCGPDRMIRKIKCFLKAQKFEVGSSINSVPADIEITDLSIEGQRCQIILAADRKLLSLLYRFTGLRVQINSFEIQ